MAEKKQDYPLIIQNGKEVDTSQIDNYDSFMAYLIASAQLSRLNKIARLLEDEMSHGWTQNFDITVTDQEREILPFEPAQSIFLVNDGPANVFITTNVSFSTPRELFPSESYSIDFKGHKLDRIFVRCLPGLTSAIRTTFKG